MSVDQRSETRTSVQKKTTVLSVLYKFSKWDQRKEEAVVGVYWSSKKKKNICEAKRKKKKACTSFRNEDKKVWCELWRSCCERRFKQ
jgi:hypothetical protein